MSAFFAMGGYGFYVWCSYVAMAIVFALEVRSLRSRRRAVIEEARLAVPEATSDLSGKTG
ncbi:MAG: heme exporter protein CcmD [Betaproteobacteria bacterium]